MVLLDAGEDGLLENGDMLMVLKVVYAEGLDDLCCGDVDVARAEDVNSGFSQYLVERMNEGDGLDCVLV